MMTSSSLIGRCVVNSTSQARLEANGPNIGQWEPLLRSASHARFVWGLARKRELAPGIARLGAELRWGIIAVSHMMSDRVESTP